MARQPVATEVQGGAEWRKAVVDAPDGFHKGAHVRVAGMTVTVTNPRGGLVMAVYTLDGPGVTVSGTLTGFVGGAPFTVTNDCNCGHGYSFMGRPA